MKHEPDKRSLFSSLGALVGWAAALLLALYFVEWTWRRKSTAWIGLSVLLSIPVTFGIALVLGFFLMAVGYFPTTLDGSYVFGSVVLAIGALASVLISLVVTLRDSERPLPADPKAASGPVVRPKFL
ncbi:MAG TPA: hypothetical protein VG146_15390, partial [Verrucomicrobiae bacterium]|nr:hypothetical protein [Verrucomicrobiae bacterium]